MKNFSKALLGICLLSGTYMYGKNVGRLEVLCKIQNNFLQIMLDDISSEESEDDCKSEE